MHGLPEWAGGLHPVAAVALLSIVPAFELSGSIPFGLLATDLSPWAVIDTALVANWFVVPIVFLFMHFALKLLLRWKRFRVFWEWYTARIRTKLGPLLDRWGAWALFIFVAIPGPGSGLYTATVGAFLLQVNLRQFVWVVLFGQLVAAAIVTAIVLTGSEAFKWLLNWG